MAYIIIKSKTYGVHKVYFDEKDRELVDSHTWCVVPNRQTFYAMSRLIIGPKKYKTIRMHQLFLKSKTIDHKNGNGLDNRRDNLRPATLQQNNFNVGLTKRNTTGYKGVYPARKGFVATLRKSGTLYHGGTFNTAKEAAVRYNQLAKQHHGEFAWLNPV